MPDYYYEVMQANNVPLSTECPVLGAHTWASLRGSCVDTAKTVPAPKRPPMF